EVLAELEKYFLLQQKLQRQFLSQIAWPAIQLFLAPFVIAFMLFFLASIAGNRLEPLGPSYGGSSGAGKFLMHFFGTVAVIVIGYLLVKQAFKQRAVI